MLRFVHGPTGSYTACGFVLLATFLASAVFFPVNPAPQGALVIPGVILAVGIVLVPALRLITGSPSLTNTENVVAVGYVLWLLVDLIQGGYAMDDASTDGLLLALIAVGVSAAAMWFGAARRPWTLPKWLVDGVSRPLDRVTVARAIPVCFLLGMSNYLYAVNFDIPALFSYLGQSRWSAPWARGQLGGWDAFRDQAPYFGYVLPSLTALLIARRGLFTFQSAVALVCTGIMLTFLSQGGGRRLVAVTVGAGLMVWVQANPNKRFKNVVVLAVGAVALAWTAQFMLNVRTRGYQDFLIRGTEYDYLHIDDNFLRLAQIIDLVPSKRPYVGSQQVVFTLVRPVPRVFWPGKPVNPGFDLPTEVGMRGVSLSSSIVGEWYLSLGWIAVVFGGWLHGRLASVTNSLRDLGNQVGNPIVYSLSVMVLIAGLRSMQELVLMSYALVAWWAASRIMTPKPLPTR
ncbi:MAG: oligosaccharide repeat unit polymerase [Acidobacteriota bacterium]|nr:oligosaccharide repeat unit polymerase [Acidobacteriota bacterium]